MEASELIRILQATIRNKGDFQVTVDVNENGWHVLKNVRSVQVEEIEGNRFTIINLEDDYVE
jgi:hypothetical protein